MMQADLIYGLASANGRAGVAIIRLSGQGALDICAQICRTPIPRPRYLARRIFHDPTGDTVIDHGMVAVFQAPASYTGEQVVEFHIHGGKAIIEALFRALQHLGCRIAAPGEFTRRAFLNGKMDLTVAEGLLDLIEAETEAQRRQALRQADGELGALYQNWAQDLTKLLAHSEAAIDFAEEDLPDTLVDAERAEIQRLAAMMAAHLQDNRRGEQIRDGIQIAIFGPPNVGKSSLLNYLAQRQAAIVSDIPGTTRDVIEVRIDLGGFPLRLFDTAGMRATEDRVESEGIRRAVATAQMADISLLMLSAHPDDIRHDGDDGEEGIEGVEEVLARYCDDLSHPPTMVILNKIDHKIAQMGTSQMDTSQMGTSQMGTSRMGTSQMGSVAPPFANSASYKALFNRADAHISVKTGAGLDDFLARLTQIIDTTYGQHHAAPITRARHREALVSTVEHLTRAINTPQEELRAENIRLALRCLGRITGTVDVEDLLDIIFRDFCIGK